MLLASELENETPVLPALGNHSYDVGYKILDVLSCDFSLDSGVLDIDELS